MRDTDLVEVSQRIKRVNVMEYGFGMFRECLRYKLEQQGKAFVVVDWLMPTARTCHACGCLNEKLSAHEKVWICPHCGAAIAREANAAKNIRDMGLVQLQGKGTSAA